jgi:hypothetical protein
MALCSPNKHFFAYHGANHGDTFQANADEYFMSSNHVNQPQTLNPKANTLNPGP